MILSEWPSVSPLLPMKPRALRPLSWVPIFYRLNVAGGMIGTPFAGPDKRVASYELRAIQADEPECGYWSPYGVAVSLKRYETEGPAAIALREMPALAAAAELMVKRVRRYGVRDGRRVGKSLSKYLRKNPIKRGFMMLQYRPDEPLIYQDDGRILGTFKWGELKGLINYFGRDE